MISEKELNSIKTYKCLCELMPCSINGIAVNSNDFGIKEDIDEENAEPYCCKNMKFIPFEQVESKTLTKYNITEQEYRLIQKKLDCLSFGECGWCE